MTPDVSATPAVEDAYASAVGQMDCKIKLGPLLIPLPGTLEGLRGRLQRIYPLMLEQYPAVVDQGVVFQLNDGYQLVAAPPFDGVRRSTDPGRFIPPAATKAQRRTAKMLVDGLEAAEATWLQCKRDTWRAARTAERVASQLALMHLLRSARLADEAEKRYVGDPRSERLRIDLYGAEFDSLRRALIELARARDEADIDTLRRQGSVMQAAALGAMVLSFLQVDRAGASVKAAFAEIEGLASDAASRAAQSNLEYLASMRRLAGEHPILVVLQHYTESMQRRGRRTSYTIAQFQGDIRDAIANARSAIASLREQLVVPVIPALTDRIGAAEGETTVDRVLATSHDEPPAVTTLIRAVEKARPTAIWKLPFFMDRAFEFLQPPERRVVQAIKENAELNARGATLAETFATVGCEAAAAVAPLAGSVGVVVAVAWGLVSLASSVREYRELKVLYDATMDPAILLRGDDHDPADESAVILDLVGLLFT